MSKKTIIYGPQGSGKTTLAQRMVKHRTGVLTTTYAHYMEKEFNLPAGTHVVVLDEYQVLSPYFLPKKFSTDGVIVNPQPEVILVMQREEEFQQMHPHTDYIKMPEAVTKSLSLLERVREF